MRIPVKKAQRYLTVVWFVGAATLFILLVLQTILGHYGDKASRAWAWLLPTFMPTLSLVVSVLVTDSFTENSRDRTVNRFIFRLSFILSITYLITVSLTILMSPFSQFTPLELMHISNIWLAPLQGLVSASIGAFFVNRKPDEKDSSVKRIESHGGVPGNQNKTYNEIQKEP